MQFPLAQTDKPIYMQFGIYEGRFINYLWLIVAVNKVGCEALVLEILAWLEVTSGKFCG